MLRLCAMILPAYPLFAATQLVLLGTGTPRADPQRFGPASAVVYNDNAYLFDAGAGVVRRAEAAAELHNIPALRAAQLRRVFITHLHSDHTLGLPDLIFSPWVLGRTQPLEVWGPKGTQAMVNDIEAAWNADIDIRTHGLEHGNDTGYRAIVHEIDPGFVYRDGALTITAIPVHHGSWAQAYGYRIQTPDRVIVLSGDCSPSPALIQACNGCDVLVHEVYTLAGAGQKGAGWIKYLSQFHTSTDELAGLAKKAHPKLLVLNHQLFSPGAPDAAALLKEMRRVYPYPVVSGSDLDVY
ncbi:MAG TPA: MBL fold metallo-hydrolase [Bryobacteraceae bacterium]|nr:MBL fold metallo-hydrolase [Bryobacteraceae bacterium]